MASVLIGPTFFIKIKMNLIIFSDAIFLKRIWYLMHHIQLLGGKLFTVKVGYSEVLGTMELLWLNYLLLKRRDYWHCITHLKIANLIIFQSQKRFLLSMSNLHIQFCFQFFSRFNICFCEMNNKKCKKRVLSHFKVMLGFHTFHIQNTQMVLK